MTPTQAERDVMVQVAEKALALHTGEGPVFTAAVMRGDRLITLDRNEAGDDCDPSRHAEIVAIARAARVEGGTDLSGCTLLASMQPCEMCLAAMRWARIDRLIFAMTQEEAPDFFQFPHLRISDFARAAPGTFEWQGGVELERVRHIYT